MEIVWSFWCRLLGDLDWTHSDAPQNTLKTREAMKYGLVKLLQWLHGPFIYWVRQRELSKFGLCSETY